MGFMMEDNQVVGTKVFDDYPTYEEWIAKFELDKPADMIKLQDHHFAHLPVWVAGNIYFNDAKPCKNETANLVVDPSVKAYVELIEKDGKYFIKTNLYEHMGNLRDGIITSDILGKAFEPEQRFENPDGSAIIFDTDYLGEHRGLRTIPGPFTSAEAAAKELW